MNNKVLGTRNLPLGIGGKCWKGLEFGGGLIEDFQFPFLKKLEEFFPRRGINKGRNWLRRRTYFERGLRIVT